MGGRMGNKGEQAKKKYITEKKKYITEKITEKKGD